MDRRGPGFANDQQLTERLSRSGLRLTPQRYRVYSVLLAQPDHPTADQVFLRTKGLMPDISMATVYNCLDALVKCGVVRQVHVERGATRYCPNMREHSHFCCTLCGRVFDIDLPRKEAGLEAVIPKGFQAEQLEISIRGVCASCAPHSHKRS